MIITYHYWLRLDGNVHIRVYANKEGEERRLRGVYWMTQEEWEQWKTWQTLAAATYAMTRADVAAGIDVQVYFVDVTNYTPSEVSP